MADRKAKTIDLQGREYAQVAERLKLFRADNPRGDIETTFNKNAEGETVFTAKVTKDKADSSSASATGHSLGNVKLNKDFEKLETIAVGRALALLGYAASGDIASSEEMEEFEKYQQDQREQAMAATIKLIEKSKSMSELKRVFMSSGYAMEAEVVEAKDKRKLELEEG